MTQPSREVVPFHEGLMPAAVTLTAGGLRRMAAYLDSSLLRPPDLPVERLVEPALRQYLAGGADGRRAWAVVDGDRLLAPAGVLIQELTRTGPAGSSAPSWASSRSGPATRSSACCCRRGTAT